MVVLPRLEAWGLRPLDHPCPRRVNPGLKMKRHRGDLGQL
jgi:hypothetical protein